MNEVNDSILLSVAQGLGLLEEVDNFKAELILYINASLMTLNQLGIGPHDGFSIRDDIPKWRDFTTDIGRLDAVKTFVIFDVRLMFDPPTNSFLVQNLKELKEEAIFRIEFQGGEIERDSKSK